MADDLVFMSDTPEGLQKLFDGLFEFCSRFQMIVNELKTKVMTYGNDQREYIFTFNKQRLEVEVQYKYFWLLLLIKLQPIK